MISKTDLKVKSNDVNYPVQYTVGDYTFPSGDTIEDVRFDDTYIHIELVDGRVLSIPLTWFPPLRDASPTDREKFQISEGRTMIFWDPDHGPVNEVFRVADYLTTKELA